VERVETASEALLVSLNETGQISWLRMESLTGVALLSYRTNSDRSPTEIRGGAWKPRRYLSGNVRAKLALAQASAQIDPAYRRNGKALRAVQPKDLNGRNEARLGSSWIPPSDIRNFVAELLDVPPVGVKNRIRRDYRDLDNRARLQREVCRQQHYDPRHRRFRARVDRAIAQWAHPDSLRRGRGRKPHRKSAGNNCGEREQQQLKDRFPRLAWEDRERAARLAQEYNFRFNNIRLRDFDGSHLTLPGMVRTSLRDGDLAPHQKNAVWRISRAVAHVGARRGSGQTGP